MDSLKSKSETKLKTKKPDYEETQVNLKNLNEYAKQPKFAKKR